MPVTEVQWIGSSCGRHSSYIFYRGFRLIVDGTVKNYCLGEFYFVRNSANQPICIAELQLVWYDSSTDSQLASARLYFRPEDTPVGRLACHGQDELVYADQKVVFKCQDMAVWQDAGDDWASGLIPLCESDFDCIDSKYYLKRNHAAQEQQAKQEAKETWLKKEHPRMLHILTFPAYCRYRALRKRLLGGACFTRTQIIALGGFIAEHKNTRVVFCRDSFHHPYLDKFELSGETKAPVLKGRPRKKKRLRGVQNSVLTKKRFVADIQNHLVSPAVKRSKFSEEEESTESDRSEDVLDKIKSFPQVVNSIQSSGPPPLIKPKIQVKSLERTNIVEVKKIIDQDVSQLRGERQKIPPPLIPSNQVKGNGLIPSQQRSSREQENVLAVSCSRTTPKLRQFYSSETQIKEAPKATDDTAVLTSESALVERIQASVAMVPVISSITAADGKSGKMFNSSVQNSTTSNPQRLQSMTTVVNTQTAKPLRSVSSSHTNVRLSTTLNTRPVASTQAVVCTSSVTSTRPVVCAQPVPKKLPVTDVRPIISGIKLEVPLQSITTLTSVRPVTSSQSMSFGEAVTSSSADVKQSVTSSADMAAKSKLSKEGEIRQLRPRSASEKRDENEAVDVNVEPIIWKKKKRLRMPGNIKDEEYEDEDEKYFMQTLRDFMKSRNTPLGKIPALGFKKVNLWTMYTTAQRYGGYDAVTSKRMWRRVYDSLGGSTTITSAATYTRRHYERLLLPYERFIRSQLKDKVDKKLPITPPSHGVSAQKDTAALPAKQVTSQPLTISNCKPEPGVQLERKVSASVKSSQGDSQTNQSRNQESENRTVPPRHATQPEMNRTVDSKVALVERQQWDAANKSITGHVARPVASPMETKVSCKSELSSITTRPFNRQSQESQSHSTTDSCQASRTATSTPITSTADARVQVVTSQQNLNYRYVKLVRQDEETSARTSAVYAKNPMADTYHANLPKEAASLQRVARKQHSDNLPTQTMDEFGIGREIIDLTLDDSLPVQKNHPSSLVRSSLESLREKSEVSGLSGLRGTDSRRDASHLQIHGEYIHDNTSRHHSLGETQPSVDMASVHGIKSYNSRHSGSPKMTLQLQEGARAQTVHKSRDKMYSNVKQESSHHKQDKVRNPQAHVESMHGRMTHSPSQESVDEHFAEWHRRQSGVQQQHSRHSVAHPRQAAEHELGQLRYTYVNEDICAQDCACSVPKKRKDNTILSPPLRMKKEHYEDDLPFTGMAVYPGRWTPPVVADHPDLYISSYTDAPHMQGSPDSLASHMCTASRIFLPQAQIFNPPYHMGMAPMAAPPLLAGSDDRRHIHPHCLISSPYPCTSNSRAPETGGYPLYSFT